MGIHPLFWVIIGVIATATAALLFLAQRRHKRHPRKASRFYSFSNRYKSEHIAYSIFLIGDTGAVLTSMPDPVMQLLSLKLKESGPESAVIFLGDNVYPRGIPPKDDKLWDRSVARLNVQLNAVKEHPGRIYFISGNHDWNKGRPGGWEFVLRQEKYIQEATGREDIYQPAGGCLGPVEINLADDLCLIFINTQWWVQEGEKPSGKLGNCSTPGEEDFFRKLTEMLEANKHKRILIAGHHPLYSNSIHGGKFSYRHHIFPLSAIGKKLYIPLPLIGSLYPLYRRLYGPKEDMSHPAYRQMRNSLLRILKRYPGLIYASGHDHNLQYIRKAGSHFIISGSGSKGAFVRKGGSAVFADPRRGFIRLDFLKNQEIWMEAWVIPPKEENPLLAYVGRLQ